MWRLIIRQLVSGYYDVLLRFDGDLEALWRRLGESVNASINLRGDKEPLDRETDGGERERVREERVKTRW